MVIGRCHLCFVLCFIWVMSLVSLLIYRFTLYISLTIFFLGEEMGLCLGFVGCIIEILFNIILSFCISCKLGVGTHLGSGTIIFFTLIIS